MHGYDILHIYFSYENLLLLCHSACAIIVCQQNVIIHQNKVIFTQFTVKRFDNSTLKTIYVGVLWTFCSYDKFKIVVS